MTKSPRKNVPDVGIELRATCMPSGHASDRATVPGLCTGKLIVIGNFVETRQKCQQTQDVIKVRCRTRQVGLHAIFMLINAPILVCGEKGGHITLKLAVGHQNFLKLSKHCLKNIIFRTNELQYPGAIIFKRAIFFSVIVCQSMFST